MYNFIHSELSNINTFKNSKFNLVVICRFIFIFLKLYYKTPQSYRTVKQRRIRYLSRKLFGSLIHYIHVTRCKARNPIREMIRSTIHRGRRSQVNQKDSSKWIEWPILNILYCRYIICKTIQIYKYIHVINI